MESRRRETWRSLEATIIAELGKLLGPYAFTQTRLAQQKEKNTLVTVKAYNLLRSKVKELEILHAIAYKIWKMGKLYLASETLQCKVIRKPIASLHRKRSSQSTEDVVNRYITVEKTGLPGRRKNLYYDKEGLATWTEKLLGKTLLGKTDPEAIAHSIFEDLIAHQSNIIQLDLLIWRVAECAKENSYGIQRPYQWKKLKPLAVKSFDTLTVSQLKQLAILTIQSSERETLEEEKERSNDFAITQEEEERDSYNILGKYENPSLSGKALEEQWNATHVGEALTSITEEEEQVDLTLDKASYTGPTTPLLQSSTSSLGYRSTE